MQQANGRLMWIVPLSIGLIMVLLYTAFNSMKDALLVMVNVVAATMGGVWALKLTGTPFSISAAVGFISIFGVAVQDGVLLISYFNQMRAAGLPVREAVHARGRAAGPPGGHDLADRGAGPACRPPWPTSIGSQAQKPLAIVVVGGMLVHPVPDPLPDARALLLLPGPGRPRPVRVGADPGLALHRPVPPPVRGHDGTPSRKANTTTSTATAATTATPTTHPHPGTSDFGGPQP